MPVKDVEGRTGVDIWLGIFVGVLVGVLTDI